MDVTQKTKDNKSGIGAILQGIDYTIQQQLKNAPYDRTFIGLVTSVDLVNNTYNVKINGYVYQHVMSTIRTYVGRSVIVMCPQNQLSQMFIYGEIDTTDYS